VFGATTSEKSGNPVQMRKILIETVILAQPEDQAQKDKAKVLGGGKAKSWDRKERPNFGSTAKAKVWGGHFYTKNV